MTTPPSFLISSGHLPKQKEVTEADLSPELLHHIEVRRLRPNETCLLMDGRGHSLELRCKSTKPYTFEVLNRRHQLDITPHIEVCLGAPKSDALTEAVAQSVEMGAAGIFLVRSQHSQHKTDAEAPTDRAQRVADAACEQASRAQRFDVFPGWSRLEELLTDNHFVHVFADEILSEKKFLGFDPSVETPKILHSSKLRLYIGPEGGWSDSERELMSTAAHALGLGSTILRVPTACVAGIFFLRHVAR